MTWLSALLLLIASLVRPTSARCAPHWWLSHGVRPDGSFVCEWLPADGDRDMKPVNPSVVSMIYCSGGTAPIVVRGVEVGCQRGGYP